MHIGQPCRVALDDVEEVDATGGDGPAGRAGTSADEVPAAHMHVPAHGGGPETHGAPAELAGEVVAEEIGSPAAIKRSRGGEDKAKAILQVWQDRSEVRLGNLGREALGRTLLCT